MKSFILNSFDVHTGEFQETLRMTQVDMVGDTFSPEEVLEVWNDAVSQVKEENPEDWHIDDAFKLLRENGWVVEHVGYIEVSY